MTLMQIALFVPAAFVMALTPGANNLMAFANATRAGWGAAVRALAGRLTAFALMVAAVAFGLDALLRTSEVAFLTLKWAGVAYLAWLGWRTWGAPVDTPAPPVGALAKRELLTALANPKAYLLFTAFLPQFADPSQPLAPQMALLGALYIATEAVAASLWAGAGAALGARALTDARRRLMNRVSGGAMMAGAAALSQLRRT